MNCLHRKKFRFGEHVFSLFSPGDNLVRIFQIGAFVSHTLIPEIRTSRFFSSLRRREQVEKDERKGE